VITHWNTNTCQNTLLIFLLT